MTTPYITPSYLLAVPSGIDWSNIGLSQPSAGQLAAEQLNMCFRASSYVDEYCNQQLFATINTEVEQGPSYFMPMISSTQQARLVLKRWPVLSVLQVQVSYAIDLNFTAVGSNLYYIENTINGYSNTTGQGSSGVGPDAIILQPGVITNWRGNYGYLVQVTYVNGWPHTTLTVSCLAGDSTLTVDDITGTVGQAMTIYDTQDGTTETVIVESATPTTPTYLPGVATPTITGPGTVTLVNPTLNAHAGAGNYQGTLISAMPAGVLQAATNFAKAELTDSGAAAVQAQELITSGSGRYTSATKEAASLRAEAEFMLRGYRQVIK